MGGVTLIAEATQRSVGIVGAVASGAGESLHLSLEPATRLNAIAIEAASNVVAHAYPGSSGPFKLEISTSREGGPTEDLRVMVRDNGGGILHDAREAEPSGLGLTVICALADELEIRSTAASGTSLEARIRSTPADAFQDVPPPDTDPRSGGTLSFAGTTFVESVLPRTLAALVAGSATAIDALAAVLRVGDAVAYGLRSVLGGGSSATVRWDGESPSEIRIGPLAGELIQTLVDAVASAEPRSEAWLVQEAPSGDGGGYALVVLPHV